jgi:RND family efflux transporter MFP subunit
MQAHFPLNAALLAAAWLLAGVAAAAPPAAAPAVAPAVAATQIRIDAAQQIALGVRLAAVQAAASIDVELPARATLPASQQTVVAAPAAGIIRQLRVGVGDRVKAGDVLAELDSAELAQLQREFADARNHAALARSQRERDTALAREGLIAERRLQQAQAGERDALALLRQRALALRQAGADTALDGLARLRAPRAGVVVRALVLPGQRVDAAAPLFQIASGDALQLEIDATPQQAAAFAPGTAVTVPAWQARGVLVAKVPALSGGQRVLLRARIDEPGALLPGAEVQARLQRKAPPDSWTVPPSALTESGAQPALLVRSAEGFRIVPVTVLARLPDAVLVRGALRSGDQVASHGVVALRAAAGEGAP